MPIWWDDAPPLAAPDELPSRVDVVIVGGGYCGLSAATTLAEGGLTVVVVDAEDPGFGCSTRNSGHAVDSGKLPDNISDRVGSHRAALMREECQQAAEYFRQLTSKLASKIDYERRGRFVAAHCPSAYQMLLRKADEYRKVYGLNVAAVPVQHQREEIGSDFYHGGIAVEEVASLHPGKFYGELRRLASEAGVTICGKCRVSQITKVRDHFKLTTTRGEIAAENVILATNGYTDSLLPDFARQIVPVSAYLVATEPLPIELAEEILPKKRNGGDTKRLVYAFRRTPNGDRVIFTGRAHGNAVDEVTAARTLHRFMAEVWPKLGRYRISHSWNGSVAMTMDLLPHIGQKNGIYFAGGCQGAGVIMMNYLGQQLGLKLLGKQNGPCAFEASSFPTYPLYNGTPWFMPPVEFGYRMRDWIDRRFAL